MFMMRCTDIAGRGCRKNKKTGAHKVTTITIMMDEILSYREMCDKENVQTLQRGMNFRLNPNYSVILMSQRKNAPYRDKVYEDGSTIEYEGHDVGKTSRTINPKIEDQPLKYPSGRPTQNGFFVKSAEDYKSGKQSPEKVKVYEKIHSGIWSLKGLFDLVDYKMIKDGKRKAFRFILKLCKSQDLASNRMTPHILRSRLIPSEVKKQVWKRDGGKCVICGAKDELHFDHDLPYSKGGTSITATNVKLLCARHNLQKSDKIV